MSDENQSKEANARIFAILSLVFSLIPIIGLIFGIIATQKGRKGVSRFAVEVGYAGIALSLIIGLLFGYWQYDKHRDEQKATVYENCLRDRRNAEAVSLEAGALNVWQVEAQCDWARP